MDDIGMYMDCLLVDEEPNGASREYIEMARNIWFSYLHLEVLAGSIDDCIKVFVQGVLELDGYV